MLIAGDPEFSDILIKGREGAHMTPNERFRLSIFYENVLRQWQVVHFQYLSAALDEDIWIGQRNYFALVFSQDRGIREHWRANQGHFSPSFNTMVKGILSRAEAMRTDGRAVGVGTLRYG